MSKIYRQRAFLPINPWDWGSTYKPVESIVGSHGEQRNAATAVYVYAEDVAGSDEFESVAAAIAESSNVTAAYMAISLNAPIDSVSSVEVSFPAGNDKQRCLVVVSGPNEAEVRGLTALLVDKIKKPRRRPLERLRLWWHGQGAWARLTLSVLATLIAAGILATVSLFMH